MRRILKCILMLVVFAGAASRCFAAEDGCAYLAAIPDKQLYRVELGVPPSPLKVASIGLPETFIRALAVRPGHRNKIYAFGSRHIAVVDLSERKTTGLLEVSEVKSLDASRPQFSRDGNYLYVTGVPADQDFDCGLVLGAESLEFIHAAPGKGVDLDDAVFSWDSSCLLYWADGGIHSLELQSGTSAIIYHEPRANRGVACRGLEVQPDQIIVCTEDTKEGNATLTVSAVRPEGTQVLGHVNGQPLEYNRSSEHLYFYDEVSESISVLACARAEVTNYSARFLDQFGAERVSIGEASRTSGSESRQSAVFVDGIPHFTHPRLARGFLSPDGKFAVFVDNFGISSPSYLAVRSNESGEWFEPVRIGEVDGGVTNVVFGGGTKKDD